MRWYSLGTFVVALGLLSQPIQAQIKLPVFDPDRELQGSKEVTYKPATEARDFRHGAMMALTMTNDTRMNGTLVRVDRKNHRLFIRTEAGAVPVAVNEKDIKKVEKATYAIRPVGSADDLVIQPEIQKVVIYNGSVPSVSYIGSSLSPSEQTYLRGLEEAENEMMRLQGVMNSKTSVLSTEVAVQAERRRYAELVNLMLQKQNWNLGSLPPPNAWGSPYDRMSGGFGMGYGFNPSGIYQLAGLLGVTSASSNTVSASYDQKDLLAVAMPTPQDAMNLRQARDNFAAAERGMLFEDGRPVAVIFKE